VAASTGNSYGVYNVSSAPAMTSVAASASGGVYGYGVYNSSSSPVMVDVDATASGSTNSCGIFNDSSSAPAISNSVAKGENGTTNTGLDGIDGAASVRNTLIVGGVANDAPGTQCHHVYDDTPAAIGC
jgi:hypothetical protein